VELELKVASLEEQLGSQHTTMQDILARLHRLERELREKPDGSERPHSRIDDGL
jgi:hypothetical protein